MRPQVQVRDPLPCDGLASQPARSWHGLSSGLIHSRPAPFTGGRPARIRARHERWRPVVNTGQQCWKACWVQALASSNLASSATLTCKNTRRGRSRTRASPTRGLIWRAHFRAVEGAASDLSRRGRPWSGPSRTVADGPERRGARRRSVLGCRLSRVQISHPGLHSSEFVRYVGTTELGFWP